VRKWFTTALPRDAGHAKSDERRFAENYYFIAGRANHDIIFYQCDETHPVGIFPSAFKSKSKMPMDDEVESFPIKYYQLTCEG
jgi:hypothetical protein